MSLSGSIKMQRKALASPSSAGSRAVARLGRTPFVVRATQEVMDAPSTSSSPSPASSSMASGGAVVQPYVNTPVSLKGAAALVLRMTLNTSVCGSAQTCGRHHSLRTNCFFVAMFSFSNHCTRHAL